MLESLGYLVKDNDKKSAWHFYERPLGCPDALFKGRENVYDYMNEPAHGIDLSTCEQEYPQEDIEIYNKSSHKEDKYILPGEKEEDYRSTGVSPKKKPLGFDF